MAPEFRRTGLAKRLMNYFEQISEEIHDCHFCDLFVRESNTAAVDFYKSLGSAAVEVATRSQALCLRARQTRVPRMFPPHP